MIRIIMLLAKRSISINLTQSFPLFSSRLVSLAALSESKVPLPLQFYSFYTKKKPPISFRNRTVVPAEKVWVH